MKVKQIKDRVKVLESNFSNSSVNDEYYGHETRLEDLENKDKYLENMSNHDYMKILGLPEDKNHKKSREHTEQVVKQMKQTLNKLRRKSNRKSPLHGEIPRWLALTSGSKILFFKTKRSYIGYCQKKEAQKC